METWSHPLRVDPLPGLRASSNEALEYFVRRDLLGQEVGPVQTLWELPQVVKILRKQQEDGSWKYPGGKPELRQRLAIYLVAPSFILTLLVGLNQPLLLKPRWLRQLQEKHPDIYPFLRDVAREEVGDDPGKAREWAEEMDVGERQEAWVAGVRKRRGWPRRELHSPEQPSVKVPRRFRRQIAQVQGLPPSSKGLEEQIVTYEGILSQLRWEEQPVFWATVQNKLGIAYAARRRGDRPENVEKAIAAYEAALVVTQKRKLLLDSAMIQVNLGAAYRRRIRGEKADNLERAISAYEAALEVFNREEHPMHWAGTQSSLGYAYSKRVAGKRK